MPGEDWVSVLASAVAAGTVEAMTSQAWTSLKDRIARLLGRGNPGAERATRERLEASRDVINGLPAAEQPQAKSAAQAKWAGVFELLLAEDPSTEAELRAILAAIPGVHPPMGQHVLQLGRVNQNANASGGSSVMQAGRDITSRARRTPPQ